VSESNREKLEAAEALLLEVRESLKQELWGRGDAGTEDAIRTLADVVVQVGRIADGAAAASPDLLEACRAALDLMRDMDLLHLVVFDQLDSAIARATGEETTS
jgi:hypothetical protein